ncbi:nucleotide exchange factor GrpE [Buchnera aphidicola]|uniref:nucleotide exchange factor GrpE n=1 Tax=Buchnera aphidicola TaxID=9 RepID=UPI0031B6E1F0
MKLDKEKKKDILIQKESLKENNFDKFKNSFLNSKIFKKFKKYEKKNIKKKIEYDSKLLNFNQIMQKNISKIYSSSLEKNFLEIFPIIDCLESSLMAIKNSDLKEKNFKKMLKNIYNKFLLFFKEYNITVIDKNNIPFNPLIHQAMSLDFSTNYPDNYVAKIIQKGYLLNIKLLRPALVSVSQMSSIKK